MENNFIKVLNNQGRTIGVIAVEKGSEEEIAIVDSFLDKRLTFKKSTEEEYAAFDGDVVKRTRRATFCHMLPEE